MQAFFESLWMKVKPHFLWLVVLLGVACIIVSYSWSGDAFGFLRDALRHIGSTMLAGGVFASMLKSFQFSGLFKEELEKLFSSKDFSRHLQELALFGHSDINVLERIMERAIAEKHPDLRKKFGKSISRFLKANYQYYFEGYDRTITVEKYDPATGLIEIIDDYSFRIIPSCDIEFRSYLQGVAFEAPDTRIDVLSLDTDGRVQNLIPTAKRIGRSVELKFPLVAGSVYRLRRKIFQKFKLSDDPIIFQQFKRVCDRMEITIVNMAADKILTDVVFINFDKQIAPQQPTDNETVYSIDNLTFPHQGYIVTLIPTTGGDHVPKH